MRAYARVTYFQSDGGIIARTRGRQSAINVYRVVSRTGGSVLAQGPLAERHRGVAGPADCEGGHEIWQRSMLVHIWRLGGLVMVHGPGRSGSCARGWLDVTCGGGFHRITIFPWRPVS